MSLLGLCGLAAASVFAGAACYITLVEQPARLQLAPGALLTQWKTAYKRGYAMQAPLAILGGLCGFAAFQRQPEMGFLFGGLLMLANWPWTLFAIAPLNKRLMAIAPDAAGDSVKTQIVQWGALHAMRSGLGLLAVLAFLSALAKS